jgi:hypothetical protein
MADKRESQMEEHKPEIQRGNVHVSWVIYNRVYWEERKWNGFPGQQTGDTEINHVLFTMYLADSRVFKAAKIVNNVLSNIALEKLVDLYLTKTFWDVVIFIY